MALPHSVPRPPPVQAWQQWWWALLIMLPSLPVSIRMLGAVLGVIACSGGLLAAFVAQRYIVNVQAATPARRDLRVVLVVALLASVVTAFAVLFPHFNSQLPGHGSDRDDALNTAIAAVLHGEYPYARTTYLGNPITPLPGALLLALPFWLLGNSAFQAVAWLAVWSAVLLGARRSWLTVFAIAASTLSPEALRETLTGGDLLANGVYVALAIWFTLQTAQCKAPSPVCMSLATLLLGVALTSRPNFLMLLPIVFAAVARQSGWRCALHLVGGACAVGFALALPFYFHAPEAFSPLHLGRKLQVPGAAWAQPVLILAGVTLPLLLAWRTNTERAFADCALVCAVPFLLATVVSVAVGQTNLQMLGYVLCAIPFACLAMLRLPTGVRSATTTATR